MSMINEHNMHMDPITINFGTRKGYAISVVEIRVGEHNGKWFLGLSINLPNEGTGRGVSVSESKYNPAFKDQDEAIEAGKRSALSWLQTRVDDEHCRSSDKEVAKQAIQEIKASNQLTLF